MHLLSVVLFAIGGVICHQRPERSFFWDGHQLPVCARCTGLYVSAAVGFLAWFAFKLVRRWRRIEGDPNCALRLLALASAPTLMSVVTGTLGLWDGSNLTRALLAIPLGLSAGAIVSAVFAKDLR